MEFDNFALIMKLKSQSKFWSLQNHFPKLVLTTLIRDDSAIRFQLGALNALQEAAEKYITDLFEGTTDYPWPWTIIDPLNFENT